MKCVKQFPSSRVYRTTDKHAALLTSALAGMGFGTVGMPEYWYASKQEWKAGGRLSIGPQEEPRKIGCKRGTHR